MSNDDRGCLLVFGIIIVGICVGNLVTPLWGWLVVGVVLVLMAVAG